MSDDKAIATDLVVVGSGAAGLTAAITAHDAGARVLLIEKMPNPGGISILSGGGVAGDRVGNPLGQWTVTRMGQKHLGPSHWELPQARFFSSNVG